MKNMKGKLPRIGVVILNYKNYEDTIDCVNSILNQTYSNYIIVIVINGTEGNSFEVLSRLYANNALISIIQNELNLGFAQGNNTGIRYALKELMCDYIFVLNNDTIVAESLLMEISKVNIGDDVGVISPKVTDIDGIMQPPTINFSNITKYTFLSCYHVLLALFLSSKYIKKIYAFYKSKKQYYQMQSELRINKYSLHGSAYFLTPNFFHFYCQLFPKTFLYWEEINLMWYLHKVNLKSVIVNGSGVIHKESQTVKKIKSADEIEIWKLKMSFRSMIKSLPMFFLSYEQIKKKYLD